MEPDVKRKTEALAKALAESDVYKNVKEARDEIDQHEAAKIMLRDLTEKQQAIQEKLLQGQEPSEAEIEDYRKTADIVGLNPHVRRLLETEMAFQNMMMEVQKMLAEAVGLEVEDPSEVAQQAQQTPPKEQPKTSRLWIPGQNE